METSVSLLDRLAGVPTDDDWRRLLDLYQPLLRAWTARAGVVSSDVDDLAQEVLLVVFREVGGFERRGQGAFRAWLKTILAHRVRNYFRGQQHRPTATGDSAFLHRLDELESPESGLSAAVGPGTRRTGRRRAIAPDRGRFCASHLAGLPPPRARRRSGGKCRAGVGPIAQLGAPRQEPRPEAPAARAGRLRRVRELLANGLPWEIVCPM